MPYNTSFFHRGVFRLFVAVGPVLFAPGLLSAHGEGLIVGFWELIAAVMFFLVVGISFRKVHNPRQRVGGPVASLVGIGISWLFAFSTPLTSLSTLHFALFFLPVLVLPVVMAYLAIRVLKDHPSTQA